MHCRVKWWWKASNGIHKQSWCIQPKLQNNCSCRSSGFNLTSAPLSSGPWKGTQNPALGLEFWESFAPFTLGILIAKKKTDLIEGEMSAVFKNYNFDVWNLYWVFNWSSSKTKVREGFFLCVYIYKSRSHKGKHWYGLLYQRHLCSS